MIVTAALCWYNETPETLDRCIRSLACIADRVVALDGAYARFPGAKVKSPPEQAKAIITAARSVNIEPIVFTPEQLWHGQVQKRAFLMRMASVDSDWVAVVDADWVIYGGREQTREVLESRISVDVWEAMLLTPAPDRPMKDVAASGWHARQAADRYAFPHLFRALPDLRVERRHWIYTAVKAGRRVSMFGAGDLPEAKRERLPHYQINHECLLRDRSEMLANRAWLNDRRKVVELTGQEDDVPGLPPPVWDYESLDGA